MKPAWMPCHYPSISSRKPHLSRMPFASLYLHGGDSDTIGAIVGSIAEARFGIPQEMKEKAIELSAG